MDSGNDTIFVLSREDVMECAREMGIAEEAITDDVLYQVKKGVEFYQDHFGTDPRGMWPAEGSVAEEVVSMISNAGIEWIATDEDVLEGSLPEIKDFTRDNDDIVQQADALYRPYSVEGVRGDPVAIIFRDKTISDLVGFQYS